MFICFEGVAGSGKTTQTQLLSDFLQKQKKRTVFTSSAYEAERRDQAARFMREQGINDDQNAIMFFFQALHAAHFSEVSDALDTYDDVITDRWRESFYAHHVTQNTFNGDTALLEKLDKLAYRSLEPSLTFLLDAPADVVHARYVEREKEIDDGGLPLMDSDYFEDVIDYYRNAGEKKGWHEEKRGQEHFS